MGDSAENLDAFLLGNLGPDPFFYLMAQPTARTYRRIGQDMHRKRTAKLLHSIHEHFVIPSQGESDPVLKAYALGFMCHYLLDSTVHPLVYAQQHAICKLPLEGLNGKWSHRVVHSTIETALDEYMLTTRFGATAATLPPHKTMLRCSAPGLASLSRAFASVIREVYDLQVPATAFETAVALNRVAQFALDSKSAGLRRRFDYLAGIGGMASSYILSLSLRGMLKVRTPFANDEHSAWEVPYSNGKTISASFGELYSSALARSREILPMYAGPDCGLCECNALVDGVNFLGRAVE